MRMTIRLSFPSRPRGEARDDGGDKKSGDDPAEAAKSVSAKEGEVEEAEWGIGATR